MRRTGRRIPNKVYAVDLPGVEAAVSRLVPSFTVQYVNELAILQNTHDLCAFSIIISAGNEYVQLKGPHFRSAWTKVKEKSLPLQKEKSKKCRNHFAALETAARRWT